MNEPFLKSCPFCDGEAEVERYGDRRQSCIVKCTDCGCHLESNENGAGHDWNDRGESKRLKRLHDQIEADASEIRKSIENGQGQWPTANYIRDEVFNMKRGMIVAFECAQRLVLQAEKESHGS